MDAGCRLADVLTAGLVTVLEEAGRLGLPVVVRLPDLDLQELLEPTELQAVAAGPTGDLLVLGGANLWSQVPALYPPILAAIHRAAVAARSATGRRDRGVAVRLGGRPGDPVAPARLVVEVGEVDGGAGGFPQTT